MGIKRFQKKWVRKLERRLRQLRFTRCEGCEHGFENQLGHTCVTLGRDDALRCYYDEAFALLNKDKLLRSLSRALLRAIEKEHRKDESS